MRRKSPNKHLICLLTCATAAILLYFIHNDRVTPSQNPVNMDEITMEIKAASQKHGVPEALIKAVIWKESNFRQYARSKAGAKGLMQLMPSAVEEWAKGTKQTHKPDNDEIYDIHTNIDIGTWYLAWCGKHWDNYTSKDILQLSEYHAGYGNVSKRWRPKKQDKIVRINDITCKTTRNYVQKILKKKIEYEYAENSTNITDKNQN